MTSNTDFGTTDSASPDPSSTDPSSTDAARSASASRITVVTFGFKYGPPPTNHYFDVSFLSNPARDPRWGLFSEPDERMRAFVMAQPAAAEFVERAARFIAFLSAQDDDLRVGLGCNAGRHRSVLLAEALCESLARRGFEVVLVHREREFTARGERIEVPAPPSVLERLDGAHAKPGTEKPDHGNPDQRRVA